jgi:glycerophosphoryl diester phosphodiesterase
MTMWASWKWRITLIGCAAGLAALYLLNASWLAAPPTGRPRIVAQRGVAQAYAIDDESITTGGNCSARAIKPPTHDFIDNTIPSIAAALSDAADIVEMDIEMTRDQQFVLFHDFALDCRTNGSGPVSKHDLADLRNLDAGYGYSADGGMTFPLRGKGVGLITTLPKVLQHFPDALFLVHIKDGDPAVAGPLVTELDSEVSQPWARITFFGSPTVLRRLKRLKPTADVWSARTVQQCGMGYLKTGWFGHVPRICDDGMIIVPIEQASLLWGWPNRFLARMREHHTRVMLIGKIQSLSTGMFSRLDTPEELAEVPQGFDGLIWTDHINLIGPLAAAKQSSHE